MFSVVMDRFVEQSPTSVMFRGTLENVVTSEVLDEIFAQTAQRQVPGELLFSSIVDLLALVTTGAANRSTMPTRRKEQFTVSVTSVYNKLSGVETEVSRQMVRQTAERWPKWSGVCRLGMLPGARLPDEDHRAAAIWRGPNTVSRNCGRSAAAPCRGWPW